MYKFLEQGLLVSLYLSFIFVLLVSCIGIAFIFGMGGKGVGGLEYRLVFFFLCVILYS